MSRKISIVLFVSLLISVPVFAQDDFLPDLVIPEFTFLTYFGGVETDETVIPEGLRNNEFFRESQRLNQLAMETFEFGDYDASAGFAKEAIRYAELSDEYVAINLIDEAKRLLDWADANNIQAKHPAEYTESKDYYEVSLTAKDGEEWSEAIDAATKSIRILAAYETNKPAPQPQISSGTATLPKQYTVRTWASVKDCLWNIAGYSWVYGDPWKWRELYNANKSRLPDPNNPDLIEPGFVIEIPSIKGEVRQGMWDPNTNYR